MLYESECWPSCCVGSRKGKDTPTSRWLYLTRLPDFSPIYSSKSNFPWSHQPWSLCVCVCLGVYPLLQMRGKNRQRHGLSPLHLHTHTRSCPLPVTLPVLFTWAVREQRTRFPNNLWITPGRWARMLWAREEDATVNICHYLERQQQGHMAYLL